MIFGALFAVYLGFYMCRSNLTVVTPLLVQQDDMSKEKLGWMISLGTIGYMITKLAGGPLADFFGGRVTLLAGGIGAVLATVGFALTGGIHYSFMFLFWIINRIAQSFGWPGLMKVVSLWCVKPSTILPTFTLQV